MKVPVKEPCKFPCVRICKIHKINSQKFREHILYSDLISCPHKAASLLSHQNFTTLCNLLDEHAPVEKKGIPKHPHTGLMNVDILAAKHFKRKCVRAWQLKNSAKNQTRYCAAVNRYNIPLKQARSSYFSRIVAENEEKPKSL